MNLAVSSIFSQQTSYRRKHGKIETKKIHRKRKLKSGHIVFAFLLLVGFFFGFSRVYLFLITWEKLIIDEVDIICQKQEIRRDLQHDIEERYLGNILLLNIGNLRELLAKHTWIEDVYIRKIFPSRIRIEALERIPIAVLETEDYYLIDKDGVYLQKISPSDMPDLPMLYDAYRFRRDYDRKLALAWACLENLEESVRGQISRMDLTEYENVSLRFKNSTTWLKLGNSHFAEKYQTYKNNLALFKRYGPLEYIDFRYEGRFVLQPVAQIGRNNALESEKEAF
jgi:cell division septal protein FtsQ